MAKRREKEIPDRPPKASRRAARSAALPGPPTTDKPASLIPASAPHLARTGRESDVVLQQSVAPCSLEFSRDAKGQPRWGIKLYGEVDQMDGLVDKVLALDARLAKEANKNG